MKNVGIEKEKPILSIKKNLKDQTTNKKQT